MSKTNYTKETSEKLQENLIELNTQYLDKKLGIHNNTEKDTSVLTKIKKDTARIKTILSERKNNE